ncbi:MAG: aminotransferase class III-fold pyridoxal phosphate-dependent enzyme [Sedimenticola sp.]
MHSQTKILRRGAPLKQVDSVHGVFIHDNRGNSYLDSCSGAAVTSLGYSCTTVIDAIARQASAIPYVHSGSFSTDAAENLAQFLIEESNGALDKAVFSTSGSEAMEVAIKLALQYWKVRGQESKSEFISREQSYHGGTLATLGIGEQLGRRAPYEKGLRHHYRIPLCCHQTDSTDVQAGIREAQALEQKILEIGAENVAAFVVETVGGSTSGAVTAAPGYFREIERICHHYDVLLILDEVMCGMGRTGSLYAFSQEAINPDIVAVGKGLAAGYQAISATLCSEDIAWVIESRDEGFVHAGTYLMHAIGCAAALATQQYIRQQKIIDNVNTMGSILETMLNKSLKEHYLVTDIRGRGLLFAIELAVENLDLSEAVALSEWIKQTGFDEGIVLYPCERKDATGRHCHLLIAPAYTISYNECAMLVERIFHTLNKMAAETAYDNDLSVLTET